MADTPRTPQVGERVRVWMVGGDAAGYCGTVVEVLSSVKVVRGEGRLAVLDPTEGYWGEGRGRLPALIPCPTPFPVEKGTEESPWVVRLDDGGHVLSPFVTDYELAEALPTPASSPKESALRQLDDMAERLKLLRDGVAEGIYPPESLLLVMLGGSTIEDDLPLNWVGLRLALSGLLAAALRRLDDGLDRDLGRGREQE